MSLEETTISNIAIQAFLRLAPISWSPRRRAASRSLCNDRWRHTTSDRYPDSDIGTAPICYASGKHQSPDFDQQYLLYLSFPLIHVMW